MIRMPIARSCSYDPQFRISEDYDFLLKIVTHHPFALMGDPFYVYSEYQSLNLAKILKSLESSKKIIGNYSDQFPQEVQKILRRFFIKGKNLSMDLPIRTRKLGTSSSE